MVDEQKEQVEKEGTARIADIAGAAGAADTSDTAEDASGANVKSVAADNKVGGISLRVLNALMIVVTAFVSLVFLQGIALIQESHNKLEAVTSDYLICESAANDLRAASSDLTSDVRAYTVTQNPEYLQAYYDEVMVQQRRDKAVQEIEQNYTSEQTHKLLESALQRSNRLMDREQRAILLVADAQGHDLTPYASAIGDISLSDADKALSQQEKLKLAESLVYDEFYSNSVEAIMDDVTACKDALVADLSDTRLESSETVHSLLARQQALTCALLIAVIISILLQVAFILWPLRHYIIRVRQNESLPMTGASELRTLSAAYNVMYEENLKSHETLRKEAEHDYLTGLLNRGVFEKLLAAFHDEQYALLLIDADHFKTVNDELGHDMGDAMLRKVAQKLGQTFRATDYACRIGGDEFAVIMTDMRPDLEYVVTSKLKNLAEDLQDTSDGLPPMTLSVGVAFNDGTIPADRIFKNADTALYKVKEAGRNGIDFYREVEEE